MCRQLVRTTLQHQPEELLSRKCPSRALVGKLFWPNFLEAVSPGTQTRFDRRFNKRREGPPQSEYNVKTNNGNCGQNQGNSHNQLHHGFYTLQPRTSHNSLDTNVIRTTYEGCQSKLHSSGYGNGAITKTVVPPFSNARWYERTSAQNQRPH